MTESTFLTPPGRAWASASAALAADVRALAESATGARVAFIVESAVLAASARFQVACRGLLAYAADAIADLVGAELGAVLRRAITADARLGRGNATSAALARDFQRVGVDIWDLPFPIGSEGMTARFALDDATVFRNEIAHGREVDVDEAGLVVADALEMIETFDQILSVLERGVVDRLASFTAAGEAE